MKYISVSFLLFLLVLMPASVIADTGAGVGIKTDADVVLGDGGVKLEATVVAGDSGSGGWHNWGGGGYTSPTTPSDNATVAETPSDNTTVAIAYTPYVAPPSTPYIPVKGEQMPVQQGGMDWGKTLLIIGGIGVAGFLFWNFVLKRKQG